MSPIIESLRVHQWAKNLLIAVPAVVGQVILQPGRPQQLALAFLAFSLAASGNYVLNDVVDAEADRRHPDKQHRPVASGRLPLAGALVLGPALLAAGLALAFIAINRPFALMLVAYVLLALGYSKFFRRLLLLDVLVLAALYTLRLIAGGAAVDVAVTSWLLVFSMFFFLSLAFAKRLVELDASPGDSARAYRTADRATMGAVGPGAGMLAVLVMALYVSSGEIRAHYAEPDVLWLLCPLLLYWVLRTWFFAMRGELHHDPVVFALRDRVSYAVGAAVLAVLFFAARG